MGRVGELDADRGSSPAPTTKQGQMLSPEEIVARRQERAGARDLDDEVERTPGTRAWRDTQRAFPRDVSEPVSHERKRRKLPSSREVRRSLSARQRDARSAAKNRAQARMPLREYQQLFDLVGDVRSSTWVDLNDALSEAAGDRQMLTDAQQQQLGRVDRAIQRAERDNDGRGHVVYLNVRAPHFINRSNAEGYAANQFSPGSTVEFDRYSGAAHNLHEIETSPSVASRTIAFEIQTRRGLYLGGSHKVDDTGHLLPRGMRLRVAGSHRATYERPDGTRGERVVVQLVDDLDESLKEK